MADKIKITLAGLLLLAGLASFYYFSTMPTLARVGMVCAGLIAAVVLGLFSAPGQNIKGFFSDFWIESAKVVWPTWRESLQTAAAVVAFSVAIALFLWGVDKILEFGLYDLILGWK